MQSLQLIRLLVDRELTLRYKRSVIGIGWTLLNPMLTSLILWWVFSSIFASRLPDGTQFAPYLIAGVLVNAFVSQGITSAAEAVAGNGSILTKVFVRPQIFTISSAMASLVNFAIGMIPFIAVVYVSGQTLAWTFPLVFVVGFFLALFIAGVGLMCSILFIRFDDSRNIVALVLMILTYLTPIFYPVSMLSETMQNVVNANPFTSYLNCIRWAASDNSSATLTNWIVVVATGLIMPAIGTLVFRKFWPRTVALF
jgi:ABC-type polysaccharide/polyol phosphate export permease